MSFDDELGEALRGVGAGFTPDPHALVEAGERRGRRLVARRRAAVAGGSVLALALVGSLGAWSGGLIGGSDGADVASAPTLPGRGPVRSGPPPGERAGSGAVTAAQLIDVLRSLTPGPRLTDTWGRGTEDPGPAAAGILDDGGGRGSIGVSLGRIDPAGNIARDLTTCPRHEDVGFDSCVEQPQPDGSRLLLIQAYDYDDHRKSVKNWRATLVTPQGFVVDANESNAAQSKASPVTRPEPPLTMDRMKALVLSEKWRPALQDLPPAPSESRPPAGQGEPDAKNTLEHLLRGYGIPVVDRGGDGGYGYVVLDDGKGGSLVELSIKRPADGRDGSTGADFSSGTTAQPLGVLMKTSQGPARGAPSGTVEWTVDTLRSNGVRVTVSVYNAHRQTGAPSRAVPALTMERLKEVALSRKWPEVVGR
ncbi:hypothetical protein [Streptomyces sp. NPDC048606]|uniref:hypothetical protein n=1 Tax=Streptomyces sp. NPDC048606 TaxID=3154726 RepID=UPI0034458B56